MTELFCYLLIGLPMERDVTTSITNIYETTENFTTELSKFHINQIVGLD